MSSTDPVDHPREEAEKSRFQIPPLGLAAAAFAGFLVLASMGSLDEDLLKAARLFAAGIPLLIVTAWAQHAVKEMPYPKPRSIIETAAQMASVIADILCAIGLYDLFRHVDPLAGSIFGWFVFASVVVIVGIEAVNELSSKRMKESTADQAANTTV
jgi:hypothetical protein